MIGHEPGEFGVGTRHLYKSLQRLAVVEPQYLTKTEPETPDERILNESDGVYRFVIAAEGIRTAVRTQSTIENNKVLELNSCHI